MSNVARDDPTDIPSMFTNRRSAELRRAARLRLLSEVDRDLIRLVNEPGYARWVEQIRATGGCAHPVYLSGRTITRDVVTGEVVHAYATDREPGERLAVRCRNRRHSVCEPCSRLHSGDTFHLIRSGLAGGRHVPDAVRERPRLFLTLTAPSFGPVHRIRDAEACRPRRESPRCDHGRALGCGMVHADGDPLVGLPLCADCYDYVAHVLWHAHAGRLWDRFTTGVRRHLASAAGLPRSRLGAHLVVSFAKIAEYQKRAAVHFHGVIRLDGPGGPGSPAPHWASVRMLSDAVASTVTSTSVRVSASRAYGTELISWGAQFDARPIRAFDDSDGLSDDAVAAYVAKYVSKGAADTGAGLDHKISGPDEIRTAAVSSHVRSLMGTSWRLGSLPELAPLRLRAWTHTLGYRGHILTKSRRYSTTYAALRAERADHQRAAAGLDDHPGTITESAWRYVGSGHTPGAAEIAAGIAEDIATNREIACEELTWGERT